jgi:hypothetical protein
MYAIITGTQFGPVDEDRNAVTANYQNSELAGLAGTLFDASSCVVQSQTQMRCKSAVGLGTNHKWSVTVGAQTSALSTATTSYRPPTVSSVEIYEQLIGRETPRRETALNTNGKSIVTIVGEDFGVVDVQNTGITAHYQNTDLTLLAGMAYDLDTVGQCTVIVDHVKIACTSTKKGVGEKHKWKVVAGYQTGTVSSFTTSYKAPKITVLQEVTVGGGGGRQNRPTPGKLRRAEAGSL